MDNNQTTDTQDEEHQMGEGPPQERKRHESGSMLLRSVWKQ